MDRFLELARATLDAFFQLEVELAELVEEFHVLPFQTDRAGRLAQDLQQLLGTPRLHEVAVNFPAVNGLDGIVEVREAGHQKAYRLRPALADPFQDLHAAHARHFLVHQDEIDAALGKNVLRRGARVRGEHVKLRAHDPGDRVDNFRFVIDNQQGAFVSGAHELASHETLGSAGVRNSA